MENYLKLQVSETGLEYNLRKLEEVRGKQKTALYIALQQKGTRGFFKRGSK